MKGWTYPRVGKMTNVNERMDFYPEKSGQRQIKDEFTLGLKKWPMTTEG
jgi:hypothetical protein